MASNLQQPKKRGTIREIKNFVTFVMKY